jgi:hypothetical protein
VTHSLFGEPVPTPDQSPGQAFAEQALIGRTHHDGDPIARLYEIHPLTTGTRAVIAAASKKSRRATKASSLDDDTGRIALHGLGLGSIATFRQHFATIFPRLRLNRRQPQCRL